MFRTWVRSFRLTSVTFCTGFVDVSCLCPPWVCCNGTVPKGLQNVASWVWFFWINLTYTAENFRAGGMWTPWMMGSPVSLNCRMRALQRVAIAQQFEMFLSLHIIAIMQYPSSYDVSASSLSCSKACLEHPQLFREAPQHQQSWWWGLCLPWKTCLNTQRVSCSTHWRASSRKFQQYV